MRAREAEAAGETCGAKPPERTWHGAWDQGGGEGRGVCTASFLAFAVCSVPVPNKEKVAQSKSSRSLD